MPRPRKPPDPRPRGGKPGPHAKGGAGSVYQTASGRYRGSFTWTDPATGTSQRVYVSGKSTMAVRAAIKARRDELARAVAPADTDLTLRQYLEQWLREVVAVERRTRTLETYVAHAARIADALGDLRLDALSRRQIQTFYASLTERGLAPATVGLTHTVLHSALEHAVTHREMLERNPADKLVLPRVVRRRVPTLSGADLRAILDYAVATGDRYSALWTLFATTALRRGEALGLRWQDVDLERGILTVRQQLIKTQTRGLEQTAPKSALGERPIKLVGPATAALRQHRPRMEAERRAARPAWSASDLVFLTPLGTPCNPKTIDTHWRRLLARGGFPHTHLHALRHTAATLLGELGVAPRVVQEYLGHATVRMTLDTYTRVVPRSQMEAMDRLEAAIWPDSGAVNAAVNASIGLEGAC